MASEPTPLLDRLLSSVRTGMLLGALSVVAGFSLAMFTQANPIEPIESTADGYCLRALWAISSAGDGEGKIRFRHAVSKLQVGDHFRSASLLVHHGNTALGSLVADHDLDVVQAEALLQDARTRNANLPEALRPIVPLVDSSVLVASLARETLTSSRTLRSCTKYSATANLCSDRVLLARDDFVRQEVHEMAVIVVETSSGTERALLGLDGQLLLDVYDGMPNTNIEFGLTSICTQAASDTIAGNAHNAYALHYDSLGQFFTNSTIPNRPDACLNDDVYETRRWLPIESATPATWLGNSALAVGVSSDNAIAQPACVEVTNASLLDPIGVLSCGTFDAATGGCDHVGSAGAGMGSVPLARVARRPLRYALRDAGATQTAIVDLHADPTDFYGSDDVIARSLFAFAMIVFISLAISVRAQGGLSAPELFTYSVTWTGSTEMPIDESAVEKAWISPDGTLDVVLLLLRVVLLGTSILVRLKNRLVIHLVVDILGVGASLTLLLMRSSVELSAGFESLLAFGGSTWLLDGLLALMASATTYPMYQDALSHSVLARVAAVSLLVSQSLPRAILCVGLSRTAQYSPTFEKGFKELSSVAAGLWCVVAFSTSYLASTALHALFYFSTRGLETPAEFYAVASGVVALVLLSAVRAILATPKSAFLVA